MEVLKLEAGRGGADWRPAGLKLTSGRVGHILLNIPCDFRIGKKQKFYKLLEIP